jgi:hypothetical protein
MRLTPTVLLLGLMLIIQAATPAGADRTCDACGALISGSYFETDGAFYHPQCFTCDHCGKSITGPFTVFRGKNYHTPCFENNVALRCAVCGGVIEGHYLLDHWGNAYHTRHKNEVLQCDFCQRFIVGELGDGMRRFRDGRALCALCAATSVTSVAEARSIVAEAAAGLSRFGIDVDPRPIRLRLVGQDDLARIAENDSHETKGFTDYLVNKSLFGRVKAESMIVYLLYGMPRIQALSTVAHELMHIWQFQRGCFEQDPALSEGSCNFASYLVIRKRGTPEAEFVIESMLKDPDRVYGEGFRRVKAYVEREGLRAWLRVLGEKKDPDLVGL